MSDSPQLHRQWKVLRLLDSSRTGWTLNELVSETDVSKKTVRRDLRVLQAQFPVSEVTQDGVKRWRMTPLKEQLNFQLTELMAVYLSSCLLEPLAGTPFWEGSRSVVQKVKGALGASGVQYLQKMAAGLATTATGSGNYEQRGELIDQLLVGIEDHAVTEIRYQSLQAEVPQSRSVHPLGLVHHRGRLYLIAWSPDHDDVRNYKVDRIESAQVQSQRFELPLEFDLSDWAPSVLWRVAQQPRSSADDPRPVSAAGGPLRHGIHLARIAAADATAGWQSDRRIPSARHRGNQTLGPQLRPDGDRAGTTGPCPGHAAGTATDASKLLR